jgi:SAM-dependent methyltransferase
VYTKRGAAVYDRLHWFRDTPAEASRIVESIEQAHPSASSLLEVACGTGRFLSLLGKRFAVEGLDINADMLAVARASNASVPLHEADMSQFDLGKTFDVVACLFSSIACVRTKTRFISAISSMARHVAPGGLLVIEPWFTPETLFVDTITMNTSDETDMKICWMYTTRKVGSEARLEYEYLVGTPAGVDHFTEMHRLGLFRRGDYAAAFARESLDLTYDPVGPARRGLYVGRRSSEPA